MQPLQTASPDLETWENATEGRVVVRMHNSQGAIDDVLVGPHKKIHLSASDRRMNQEQAAGPSQDMFQNGFLAPVRLIESEADTQQLSDNPNVITEEEMTDLFSKPFDAFCARLNEISLPITLQRLLRLSNDVETAQVRQVATIRARIQELAPTTHSEVVTAGGDGPPSVGRAVAPR